MFYSDISVVKISSEKVTDVAEFGDSGSLTVGETAIAIGSPLGTEYANSVTQGIISSLGRNVTLQSEMVKYFNNCTANRCCNQSW